jgi:hypothetical protein
MSAFQDSNHTAFAPSFYPPGRPFRRYAGNHPIAMHGNTNVFGRDEEIWLAGFFRSEKPIACRMNR